MADFQAPADWVAPAFYPPRFREHDRPRNAHAFEGMSYSALQGYRELQVDVYVPRDAEGPVPCVFWIHGGAWLTGTRSWAPVAWEEGVFFQRIVDAGFAVASLDYRHSREAPFPAQLHDGFAAIRYLRRFAADLGIDPSRFARWGESAGGHLAALLALVSDPELVGVSGVGEGDTSVSAVVDYYGVSDVRTMPKLLEGTSPAVIAELRSRGEDAAEPLEVLLDGAPWPRDEAERLVSPVAHVHPDAPPFLLIHGDADSVVPIAQSEQLHAALQDAGVHSEFERVPGAEHVFLGTDPTPQFDRAIEFLRARV